MADKEIVAATIAAILAAHGKTKQKNIQKAIRAYHACLDELNKPPQPPGPERSKEDQAAIDRANNEGWGTVV